MSKGAMVQGKAGAEAEAEGDPFARLAAGAMRARLAEVATVEFMERVAKDVLRELADTVPWGMVCAAFGVGTYRQAVRACRREGVAMTRAGARRRVVMLSDWLAWKARRREGAAAA